MPSRDELIRCGALAGLVAMAALGCGVQGHPLAKRSGNAGVAGSTSGAAGTTLTGVAGTTPATGAAGTFATTGAAGTSANAAAGGSGTGTGSAGTFGSAGVSGAAGTGTTTGGAGTSVTGAAGTSTPSGVTINIGGVNVAKENAIAFVHFGHSNMAGRGVDPPSLRPYFFDASQANPHAWMYHSGMGFQPALEPGTAGDGGNRLNGLVSGGPGTALVKQAAEMSPSKYFISVGFGRGSAYCSQFLPNALYYDQVITGAKELKGKVTFAAMVILLGITERHGTPADIANYPQCINTLVTAVRTDLGEPNLPVLLCDYEMGTTGPNNPTTTFAQAIIPKIRAVPGVVSNLAIVPTDNPFVEIQPDNSTNDWHHFSLNGHKEYTRRVLQTMHDKGWWHW